MALALSVVVFAAHSADLPGVGGKSPNTGRPEMPDRMRQLRVTNAVAA